MVVFSFFEVVVVLPIVGCGSAVVVVVVVDSSAVLSWLCLK